MLTHDASLYSTWICFRWDWLSDAADLRDRENSALPRQSRIVAAHGRRDLKAVASRQPRREAGKARRTAFTVTRTTKYSASLEREICCVLFWSNLQCKVAFPIWTRRKLLHDAHFSKMCILSYLPPDVFARVKADDRADSPLSPIAISTIHGVAMGGLSVTYIRHRKCSQIQPILPGNLNHPPAHRAR